MLIIVIKRVDTTRAQLWEKMQELLRIAQGKLDAC